MQQVIKKNIANNNGLDVSKKSYHLVIDGNSILKSSLVNKDDVNDKNEEYGAVLLFLRRVGNLLLKRDFDRCVVCWDGFNSGALRWQIYKDYKANRDKDYASASALTNPESSYDAYIAAYCRKVMDYNKKSKQAKGNYSPKVRYETDNENFQRQRQILQDILSELFVRQYMYENVEGDDLIAYYCQHKKENDYIVIVSEDRDISQLINEQVCLYLPKEKIFVSTKNDAQILGVPAYNMVLKKMICGDASDNIKGVKGIGEPTLEKYYPQIKSEKATLNGFLDTCKQILEERKAAKKKPLTCLVNAINQVTDGCQGDKLYEINEKIIDLKEPLLTPEAKEELDAIVDAPIDPEGLSINNVYSIVEKNGMYKLSQNINAFGNLFGMYSRITKKEKEYFEKCQNDSCLD